VRAVTKRVDIDKIAKGLGAHRLGMQETRAGYFGAMQLVADVKARFRTPKGGGRPTDPEWTQRRIVPLADRTLGRLEQLAKRVGEVEHVRVEPMQVAALILERTLERMTDEDTGKLIQRLGRPPGDERQERDDGQTSPRTQGDCGGGPVRG
jgi:hypothetical protein